MTKCVTCGCYTSASYMIGELGPVCKGCFKWAAESVHAPSALESRVDELEDRVRALESPCPTTAPPVTPNQWWWWS